MGASDQWHAFSFGSRKLFTNISRSSYGARWTKCACKFKNMYSAQWAELVCMIELLKLHEFSTLRGEKKWKRTLKKRNKGILNVCNDLCAHFQVFLSVQFVFGSSIRRIHFISSHFSFIIYRSLQLYKSVCVCLLCHIIFNDKNKYAIWTDTQNNKVY